MTLARRIGSSPASLDGLLPESDGIGGLAVVVADQGSQAEGLGALRTGRRAGDRRLEDPVGLDVIRDVDEEGLGGEPRAAHRVIRVRLRRQRRRPLVQRRRIERRTAVADRRRGRLERRRDVRIAPSVAPARWRARTSSEVAVRASAAWARWSAAPSAPASTAWPRSGCVNRTRAAVHRGDPCFEGGPSASGASGSARLSPSIVGSAATAASSRAERVASGSAARRASRRLAERVRDRHAPVRRKLGPIVAEGAGDLECVERVAGRGLLDPDECQSRERAPEPRQEQLVQRGERQRPELESIPSVWRHAARAARSCGRRARRGPPGGGRSAGRRAVGRRRQGSRRSHRRATGRRRSRRSAGRPRSSCRRRVAVATESVR